MACRGGRLAVLWALTFCCALATQAMQLAQAAQIRLAVGSIEHEAFTAENVSLSFDAARRGEADIRVERLRIGDNDYQALRLHCRNFHYDGRRLECPEGHLHREGRWGAGRSALPFSLVWRDDGYLDFSLRGVEALAFAPLIKRLRAWNPVGTVDLALRIDGGQATLDLAAHELGFADRQGDVSGRNIDFTLAAQARRQDGHWDWQARLDWPRGELFRAPWRQRNGVQLAAEGRLDAASLQVTMARLAVAGLGEVTASLKWDRQRGEATDYGFITAPIDLAATQRDWLQPWLASLELPSWQLSGEGRVAAEWHNRELTRFFVGLNDARLADDTGYVALDGVEARIPWHDGEARDAEISVGSARLGDLPLGGFTLPLRIVDQTVQVEGLSAPLLDGRFVIDSLQLRKSPLGWHGEFEGGIETVSMAKLSAALKLPIMAGSLSARIPRITYEPGVLNLDGALAIEVFDGGIIAYQLRMLDPFSRERRLLADVTARNLDLGMLTRTFAFGAIEGRFDADLRDLEMQGWQPLRFKARVASSEGDYPRQLSLGALKDITALGESGEPKALARVPERSGFSLNYERIDFGCTLSHGVCLLEGLAREGDGVVLMRGSGMPSVNIIGYNRHIDWEALVARFRAVLAGRPGVVIE